MKRIRDSIVEHFYEQPAAVENELINFDPVDNKPTVVVKKRPIVDSSSENEKMEQRNTKIAKLDDSSASLDDDVADKSLDESFEDIEFDKICDKIICESSQVVQNGDNGVDRNTLVEPIVTKSQDQIEDRSQLEMRSPDVEASSVPSQMQQTTLSQWSRGDLKNIAVRESVCR